MNAFQLAYTTALESHLYWASTDLAWETREPPNLDQISVA